MLSAPFFSSSSTSLFKSVIVAPAWASASSEVASSASCSASSAAASSAASSPSVWSPVESEPVALSVVSPAAASSFTASSPALSLSAPASLDPDPIVTSPLVSPLSAVSNAFADAAAISFEMFCQPAATAATVGEHAWSTMTTVMNSANMRFAVLIDSVPLILKLRFQSYRVSVAPVRVVPLTLMSRSPQPPGVLPSAR